MSRTTTFADFLIRTKTSHPGEYIYPDIELYYKNTKTKIPIICKTCNNKFWQRPNDHLRGQGCPECSKKKGHKKVTSKKIDFVNKANIVHPHPFCYIYDDFEYINAKTKGKILCPRCNNYFFQTPNDHLSGHGCPFCAKKIQTIKKTKTIEQFKEDVDCIFGANTYNLEKFIYKNNKNKGVVYCNTCKKEFLKSPADLLKGSGCPVCSAKSKSKGETSIIKLLEKNNLKFIYQKKFINCKDKNQLPFDFYLPDHNLCIEYQGEQHYVIKFYIAKINDYKKTQKMFEKQQLHDQIKREFCKNNGIKLLEIRYDENIKEKLEEALQMELKGP